MSSAARVIPQLRRQAGPHLSSSSSPSILGSIVFYGVIGILLFGPLAFGDASPGTILVLEITSAALFGVWIAWQFSLREMELLWNPLFAPMLAFLLLAAVQIATRTTAYRYATFSSVMLYFAYGMLCFLAVQSFRSARQVKLMTIILSAYGSGIASFGLIQSLTSNGKIYWLYAPQINGWIYGPYVNHNHYAGLMEMLLPIPLVFSLTDYARGGRRMLAIVASAIMAATIFLCGSRGGMLAFLCEVSVLAFMLMLRKKEISDFRGRVRFLLLAFLAAGLLAWSGSERLSKWAATVHPAKTDLSAGLRLQIDRDMVRMFPHHPAFGFGLGTFQEVYPEFRSFYTDLHIDEAHNDYLQLLVEMGTAGFIVMMWFLWLLFRRAWKKLIDWPADINGAVTLAAILGIVGILVHSFVDFNLQVPANAAIFYVLCTIAAMELRFRFSAPHFRRRRNIQ